MEDFAARFVPDGLAGAIENGDDGRLCCVACGKPGWTKGNLDWSAALHFDESKSESTGTIWGWGVCETCVSSHNYDTVPQMLADYSEEIERAAMDAYAPSASLKTRIEDRRQSLRARREFREWGARLLRAWDPDAPGGLLH